MEPSLDRKGNPGVHSEAQLKVLDEADPGQLPSLAKVFQRPQHRVPVNHLKRGSGPGHQQGSLSGRQPEVTAVTHQLSQQSLSTSVRKDSVKISSRFRNERGQLRHTLLPESRGKQGTMEELRASLEPAEVPRSVIQSPTAPQEEGPANILKFQRNTKWKIHKKEESKRESQQPVEVQRASESKQLMSAGTPRNQRTRDGGLLNKKESNTSFIPMQSSVTDGRGSEQACHNFQVPYQLLKYSAISRCGMVLKQVVSTGEPGSGQLERVMAPKVNQDSFKVVKGFPTNTKAFNWLFELYDGHGPHGEIVSNWAASKVPELLDTELKLLSQSY